MGFAKDRRRANVMLSRAQQLMVVVGDAEGLTAAAMEDSSLLLPALACYAAKNKCLLTISKGTLIPFELQASNAANRINTKQLRVYQNDFDTRHIKLLPTVTQPVKLSAPMTALLERTLALVLANDGVIGMKSIMFKIPSKERPKEFHSFPSLFNSAPELHLVEVGNNEHVVVHQSVVNKAAAHFKTLLMKHTPKALAIKVVKEHTPCKTLGLPDKNILSIENLISILPREEFLSTKKTLSLRIQAFPVVPGDRSLVKSTGTSSQTNLNEVAAKYIDMIKAALGVTAGHKIVLCQVPSLVPRPKDLNIKLKTLLEGDPDFILFEEGTTTMLTLMKPHLSMLTRAKDMVLANSGAIDLNTIMCKIPKEERPRKLRSFAGVLKSNPELHVVNGGNNNLLAVHQSVVDKAAAHFKTLLSKHPQKSLKIEELNASTPCDTLGLPDVKTLSIENLISILPEKEFYVAKRTLSLRAQVLPVVPGYQAPAKINQTLDIAPRSSTLKNILNVDLTAVEYLHSIKTALAATAGQKIALCQIPSLVSRPVELKTKLKTLLKGDPDFNFFEEDTTTMVRVRVGWNN